jgi:hypothetical protein
VRRPWDVLVQTSEIGPGYAEVYVRRTSSRMVQATLEGLGLKEEMLQVTLASTVLAET